MTSKLVGLRIDIETRSGTDIKQDVYRYTEDPDFRVLIIGYAPLRETADGTVKMGRPRQLDLTDSADVFRFKQVICDTGFQKHAFNAAFERVVLSRWLGMETGDYLDPVNWHCSAVKANVSGVFGSLNEVADAVRSPITKDTEGKRLIRLFSKPQRDGTFTRPQDAPVDFARFGTYCEQDVLTEAVVAACLPDIPAEVQAQYEADQRINDRGVGHNRRLAEQAVRQVEIEKNRLMGELKTLTGLENPNSVQQMRGWLADQDYPMDSLDKAHREEALADPLAPEQVVEALVLKGAASLSSVSKHKAALNTRCEDGRIRGALRFYGTHTGREAGRGMQVQNLPRYEAPQADRRLLVSGNAGERAPEIAKGTVRSSLVPARGNVFVVCDYNSIEARVLGWLAGEGWVEAECRGAGKIYEATAAAMFGVPKATILAGRQACFDSARDSYCGKCQACVLRGQGKVANLALGYAGGAGALVRMGAEKAGIDIGNYADLSREWEAAGKPAKFHEWERDRHDYPELIRLRDLYREGSPQTVTFWKHCARAWDMACAGKAVRFGQHNVIAMLRDGRHNRVVLPSGRSIWYRFARNFYDDKNPDRIDRRVFIGQAQGVGTSRHDVHGGVLTNNITQAVARDLLFDLIMRIEDLTAQGWPGRTVLHVHDEVVLEAPAHAAQQVLDDVLGMMSQPPAWGAGLAVKGEGQIMARYGK